MLKNYTLIKKFNYGGQANTYLALSLLNDKKVVIKELILSDTKNWKEVELFDRESKILKNLKHKDIPSYLDSFHDKKDGKKALYLVQEYIEGVNLEEFRKKNITLKNILVITKQLLEILDYLHDLVPPVIHRDINPSNIMVVEKDQTFEVKLIDFGTVNKSIIGNIGSSTIVGTIGYIAPEQLMGKASSKSDLYSVGAVLLYLITRLEPSDFPLNNMQIIFKENTVIKDINNPSLEFFISKLIDANETERYLNTEVAISNLSELLSYNSIPAYQKILDNNLARKKKKYIIAILTLSVIIIALSSTIFFKFYLTNTNTKKLTIREQRFHDNCIKNFQSKKKCIYKTSLPTRITYMDYYDSSSYFNNIDINKEK